MRRCAVRLSTAMSPLSGMTDRQANLGSGGYQKVEKTLPQARPNERAKKLRTVHAETGEERDTTLTAEGGRVDYVKVQWPPQQLDVAEVPLDKVRVKHGIPWPSLYPALDVWQGAVNLRYIIDSSYPPLSEVVECSTCAGEDVLRPLKLDDETEEWVRKCIYHPYPAWKHKLYRFLVDFGVYRYAAGAYVGCTEMYMFSRMHVDDILGNFRPATTLDVGAGLGDVTRNWLQAVVERGGEYYATEISPVMVRRLRRLPGMTEVFLTPDVSPEHLGGRTGFDLVTCFNVLDRCSEPSKLLHDLVNITSPGGKLIISLPMPLKQAQYNIGEKQELLWPPAHNTECAWEHAVQWFAKDILLCRYGGSQVKLSRVVRAPYMSNGPSSAPLSVLDGAVFVLDKLPHGVDYRTEKRWVNRRDRPIHI